MQLIAALLFNRWALGGAAIIAVLAAAFFAGDRYGFNARKYAACKTETARRNAAISAANREEERRHALEEERRMHQSNAFAQCPGIQQCILTKETAACLDLLD
jgi:hypothetical protein